MPKNAGSLATAFVNKEKDREEFKQSYEVVKPSQMSPFRGMFGESKLTEDEEKAIKNILDTNMLPGDNKEADTMQDMQMLKQLTTEIKAISNQSVLLHGERIKKAQNVLRNYKDGAFTQWLISTYGNRQTPYCMLQYYEFYHSVPADKRPMIEKMPKKAAYTLASRTGELDVKLDIVEKYKGERQNDIIALIQETFPMPEKDKRKQPVNVALIDDLERIVTKLDKRRRQLGEADKMRIQKLLAVLQPIALNEVT